MTKPRKKLLTEAGYPTGFGVTMNCPNDRYVNDGEICQAVSRQLARIGVEVNVGGRDQGHLFPEDPAP
jgi:peptide/nickel transport system substrate-binding protein